MLDWMPLSLLSLMTDALMLVTVWAFWRVLVDARKAGPEPLQIAVPLLVALAWGALWVWYPPLAAARLAPPPGGQVIAIAAVVLGLVALRALPSVRTYFATVDFRHLAWIGPWRIVYGGLLLLMGLKGGLPEAFFWSAAVGDIAVGVWAVTMLPRLETVSAREFAAWNAVGLADLLHVLVLGAINLRPFFLSHPDIVPPLNLLPLVGVPMFIALHVHVLWGLRSQRVRAVA
jgi:hypothetical protein